MPFTRSSRVLFLACLFPLLAGCVSRGNGSSDTDKYLMYVHIVAADLALQSDTAFQSGDDWQEVLDYDMKEMRVALKALPAEEPQVKKAAVLVEEAGNTVASFERAMPEVRVAQEANMSFQARTPDVLKKWDEVIRAMADSDANVSQLVIASRQVVISDRMTRRALEILEGGESAPTAADAFSRDLAVYQVVLDGFTSGNADIGLERLRSGSAQAALRDLQALQQKQKADADRLFERLQAVLDAHDAKERLRKIRMELLEAAPPKY